MVHSHTDGQAAGTRFVSGALDRPSQKTARPVSIRVSSDLSAQLMNSYFLPCILHKCWLHEARDEI
jgi:hypothetical protein